MYALLVSESFAPWFFAVGIPVALLCALCFALTLAGTRGLARRFYVYFLVLSAMLAALGSINTKRLPFLLGWLFLPMAVAVAVTRSDAPRLRRVLACSLGIVFAVGWFGTFQRRYYASTHFIDDWKDAVAAAMADHARGDQIVYDHPVGGYYLGRALDGPGSSYKGLDGCHHCGAEEADAWFADGHPGVRVVALRGVQYGLTQDSGDAYLDQTCRVVSERHYTHDNAAAIKHRLFSATGRAGVAGEGDCLCLSMIWVCRGMCPTTIAQRAQQSAPPPGRRSGNPGAHNSARVRHRLSQNPVHGYLDAQNRRLDNEQHYTRDTKAAMKRCLFPTQREPEWWITVAAYNCPAG